MQTCLTFAATIQVEPESCSAWVQLAGDVDLAAEDRLGEILSALSATQARNVYVDLVGVAFAGTSLINFLVRAGTADSLTGPVVLCRVPANVRRMVETVGLQRITVLRDDERWDERRSTPAPSLRPVAHSAGRAT